MKLSDMLAAKGYRATVNVPGVRKSLELDRITALPRREPRFDDFDVSPWDARFTRSNVKCDGCPLCKFGKPGLRPLQAAALAEAEVTGGLVAPLPVGAGKTLVTLLLPDVLKAQKAVILVKSSLKVQLEIELPYYQRHFRVPREKIVIVSYPELSSADRAEILVTLNPDLVIADEAQELSHTEAARTKRFLRFMYGDSAAGKPRVGPGPRFVALSGTLFNRSIKEAAHFYDLALHEGSPLPRDRRTLDEWAAAIDPPSLANGFKNPLDAGALRVLASPGEEIREAFRRRVVDTPGVVSTRTASVGTSLSITIRPFTPDPAIHSALAHLRKYQAWEGEEVEDGMALARIAKQLACGFYYRWVWPGGVPDQEWLDARAGWNREVRLFLERSAKPGMDSPLLLARAAQAGLWASRKWAAWEGVRDRPAPPVEAVWISDALARDVLEWGAGVTRRKRSGVVFYSHRALGERLKQMGMEVFADGDEDSRRLAATTPEKCAVIVCSLQAHGTGKNLQAWNSALVTTPPSNGMKWEQMLGRLHRPGQMADEVSFETYDYVVEFGNAMKQAVVDAEFLQATAGSPQKILYANHDGWRK